jgi:coenzyme F420-reducing hydrogenase delta subunit
MHQKKGSFCQGVGSRQALFTVSWRRKAEVPDNAFIMSKLDQTVEEHLRAIEASCPRLLCALHASLEAVWGEIMRMELACGGLEMAWSGVDDQSGAVCEIMTLVEALHRQVAKDGLMEPEELAACRQGVSALQRCLKRLRNPLAEAGARNVMGQSPRDAKVETGGLLSPALSGRGGEGDANGRPAVSDGLAKNRRRLKTCVFYCSNNLDAGRVAASWGDLGGDTVKTIGLPCSGKVDVPYLVKALETGMDDVVIVACQTKECRHFEGSLRAHKRAQAVESLLEEIGLVGGRMAVIECAAGGAEQACNEIKQFIEQVRRLPLHLTPGGAMNTQERTVA